jgi:hypothetical protein
MSNKQLFWVARAVFEYRKLHREVPLTIRILGDYFNGINFEYDFKRSKNFQEAFGCKNDALFEKNIFGKLYELSIFGFDVKEFEKIHEKFKFLG